jgi:hypothetical protein
MTVPPEFKGGWFRVDMSINGGVPTETQTVWWLQANAAFADLRVPITPDAAQAPVDSFAGVTTWDAPSLTWHRELDLHGRPDADTGVIEWDGDDMLEDGKFGFDGNDPVSYRERWRRLPDPGGAGILVLRNDTSRLVCVGNYAITIVDDGDSNNRDSKHRDSNDRDRTGGTGSYRATGWYRPSVLWEHTMSYPSSHEGVSQPPDDTDGWVVGASVRLDDGTTWTVEEIEP